MNKVPPMLSHKIFWNASGTTLLIQREEKAIKRSEFNFDQREELVENEKVERKVILELWNYTVFES